MSMQADLALNEPKLIEKWEKEKTFLKVKKSKTKKFILHDGPPYANGEIHHGHALNKILKDFIVKYKLLDGHDVDFTPGWDCHGLPIELKVEEQLGSKKSQVSKTEFRNLCADYAKKWIDIQSENFKRLLIFSDFENKYKTLDFEYEASIIRAIGEFMDKDFIYKGLKPVYWSWAAATALAESEVEYDKFVTPSVYVKFELKTNLKLFEGKDKISVLIWTTTPWTLPANSGVALNPELEYSLVNANDEFLIISSCLIEKIMLICNISEFKEVLKFKGSDLFNEKKEILLNHPFYERESKLILADYITSEQGTGCVHIAPGHGIDDFEAGKNWNLKILCPVDKWGKFTKEVPEYEGIQVFKANQQIIDRLFESNKLLNNKSDKHTVERFPHCWRTKKPLIFRSTEQWFIKIDHNDLRQKTLNSIKNIEWIPSFGESRIKGMIETRPDWCISRQRVWGTPIPILKCKDCGKDIISSEVAYYVSELVKKNGPNIWFEKESKDLLPNGFKCTNCNATPENFEKCEDVIDVWFDSGISWRAVLNDKLNLDVVDLYLEGSDQHRGWFHTSLLTSNALQDKPPVKTILTHGFIIDQNGDKYSKSNPNYEPLSKTIQQYGADVIRVWVATTNYKNDVVFSKQNIEQASNIYKKIRNTIRFLLGNISDFDYSVSFEIDNLEPVNKWALQKCNDLISKTKESYENYDFNEAIRNIFNFCNIEMSSVFLDAKKDVLYCDDKNSNERLQTQWTISKILGILIPTIAPIMTYTAEESWNLFKKEAEELFETNYPEQINFNPNSLVDNLINYKSKIYEKISELRPKNKDEKNDNQVNSSQEVEVTIYASGEEFKFLADNSSLMAKLFVLSEVKVTESTEFKIEIQKSKNLKCDRCWFHRGTVSHIKNGNSCLCKRCGTLRNEEI